MVRSVRAAACAGAVAITMVVRTAEAAPALRIEWPDVPGCPPASVVLQRARAALAQAKEADDVLAIAEVTPPIAGGDGWQLHIRTRTVHGRGERTLEANSCDGVARAAALLVALAALRTRAPLVDRPIDEIHPPPDRVEEPGAVPFSLTLVDPPKARPEREMPAVKRAPTDDARFTPSVGVGFASGLLPRMGLGANASFDYEASWLRARAGVRAFLPQEEIRWGLGAELSAMGASLDLCGRLPIPGLARARLHGCAGAAIDDVRAHGLGGAETSDLRRTAMMAFVGLGAEWDLGRRYRIGVDVRGGGLLARPRFVIVSAEQGERELHRPSVLRTEGSLLFGLVF